MGRSVRGMEVDVAGRVRAGDADADADSEEEEAFTTLDAGIAGFAAATADVVGVLVVGVVVDVVPGGGFTLTSRGWDIGVS
jgi:hypothetical protein